MTLVGAVVIALGGLLVAIPDRRSRAGAGTR
jgi:hypothetical protein